MAGDGVIGGASGGMLTKKTELCVRQEHDACRDKTCGCLCHESELEYGKWLLEKRGQRVVGPEEAS